MPGSCTQFSSLVCYNIDSDSESDTGESIVDLDVKPKLEEIEPSDPDELVRLIIDEMLSLVVLGPRDFSDMYIKQEPIDIDEVKTEFDCEYRDEIKLEVFSSSDSDDDDDAKSTVGTESIVGYAGNITEADIRTKNELQFKDLPLIEDLDICLSESDVIKIGTVSSCVEELVVVESLPGNPAIDIDSVLFLDAGRRSLGRVFDVIGPVTRPFYCVRFNSSDHIRERSIEVGQDVYYAPKSEYTIFVFLDQLMKLKITDASWKNDEEPPPNFLDFSDDEEERLDRQNRTIEKMKANGATETEVARKRAKLRKNTQDDECTKQSSHTPSTFDGNMRYNSARHDNGMYSQSANPFYRQDRRYNPRAMGSIRWNSYMPPVHDLNTATPPPLPLSPAQPQSQMHSMQRYNYSHSSSPYHSVPSQPPPTPPGYHQPRDPGPASSWGTAHSADRFYRQHPPSYAQPPPSSMAQPGVGYLNQAPPPSSQHHHLTRGGHRQHHQ